MEKIHLRRARTHTVLAAFIALVGLVVVFPEHAHAQAPKTKALPPRVGSPEAKPKTKGAVRLVAYNIENLFDDKDDPALSGKNEDLTSAKPAAHKQAAANAIIKLDADIIAMVEVESLEALIEFRDQYLAGRGYDHVVSIDAGDERGIENAVLSRFPIIESRNWVGMQLEGEHPEKDGNRPNEWFGKPLTFHRSPLRVTIEVPADRSSGGAPYQLTLFVVHSKSGRNFNYWREAESKGTLKLIEEFTKDHPDANIAVLGDFNAETQDDSVQEYLRNGFADLFIDRPLDDARSLTHASDRAIDLILYNKALAHEIIRQSRFVLGTPQLDTHADWRTAAKPDGYASDHCPVVVDLTPSDR
ncbi:MAG: endonuclease/exonuclease/phosphatase family protein [Phycisphaerae bacterium]|nr:endonuclease/exonuclease/phosphatase family protein [Phycisphaerae bacterium]